MKFLVWFAFCVAKLHATNCSVCVTIDVQPIFQIFQQQMCIVCFLWNSHVIAIFDIKTAETFFCQSKHCINI